MKHISSREARVGAALPMISLRYIRMHDLRQRSFSTSHLCRCHVASNDNVIGGYGSVEGMGNMVSDLEKWENETGEGDVANRVYYFAIPPDVFLDTAACIKEVGISAKGFTRLVVEKPFGHDYESALKVGSSFF